MEMIDKFGKLIVENIRDKSLAHFLLYSQGLRKAKGQQVLQTWINQFSTEDKDLMKRMVLTVLDGAMHDVLRAIQESHHFQEGVEVLADGINVAEKSGELHAELFGDNGWIARFSKYPPSDL